jgi:hypothetical protein
MNPEDVGGKPGAVGVRISIYSSAGERYWAGVATGEGVGIVAEGRGMGMREGPEEAPRRGFVMSRSALSLKMSPEGSSMASISMTADGKKGRSHSRCCRSAPIHPSAYAPA